MNKEIHPNRYRSCFNLAITRIEKIVSSVINEDGEIPALVIKNEFGNLDDLRLAAATKRTAHIEDLIHGWRMGGEISFDLDGVDLKELDDFGSEADYSEMPTPCYFVNFGLRADLSMNSRPEVFIDGMYIRIASRSFADGIEVTFVCSGSDWPGMAAGRFGGSIKTAARMASGFTYLNRSFHCGMTSSILAGDPELISDPSIERAIHYASAAMVVLKSRGYQAIAQTPTY